MEELSLHMLDLIENSLTAGADLIQVEIVEDAAADRLEIEIADNGRGMAPAEAARAADPFYTTRTTRRVGLGLSLMKANAMNCLGDLVLTSSPGHGTTVRAWFSLSHLDRQPLGDWPGTLANLMLTQPGVDFAYRHRVGEDEFELDTRELRRELGEGALGSAGVTALLREQIRQALGQLGSRA